MEFCDFVPSACPGKGSLSILCVVYVQFYISFCLGYGSLMGAAVNVNIVCSINLTQTFRLEILPKGHAFYQSRLFINRIYFLYKIFR